MRIALCKNTSLGLATSHLSDTQVVIRLTRLVKTAMPAKGIAALELSVEAGLVEEVTAAAALWASRGPPQLHWAVDVRLTRVASDV